MCFLVHMISNMLQSCTPVARVDVCAWRRREFYKASYHLIWSSAEIFFISTTLVAKRFCWKTKIAKAHVSWILSLIETWLRELKICLGSQKRKARVSEILSLIEQCLNQTFFMRRKTLQVTSLFGKAFIWRDSRVNLLIIDCTNI